MASRNQHLDATTGREVVYCHRCRNEWHRDERPNTLECPRCHSDITEIVRQRQPPRRIRGVLLISIQISPENDPREDDHDSLPDLEHPSQRLHNHHHRHHFDSDDDFDDDDIEEHILHGPGGFFSHRTVYRSPEREGPESGSRTAPNNADQIIRRFTELLGDIGGPSMAGRSGPETLFASQPPRVTHQRFYGPGFTGGVSSFTITTGPGRTLLDSSPRATGIGAEDPFQRIFGNIMGEMGPPPMGPDGPRSPNQEGSDGNNRQPADFSLALSQLIASLINPQMVHGDAVYSQEALDRIITNLMEANPQSNAPAPASDEAIAKLPRKKLDEAMLGPELKGECTICIDEMMAGDEAVVLPCKHWFHEQCVVLWLKQHNTCPICRAPIDGEAAGRPGAAVLNTQGNSSSLPLRRAQPSQMRPERSERPNQAGPSRQSTFRRDSNSPPMYSGSGQPSRVRSPSPSSRRSPQSERPRDNRGSSSSGPLNWLRDRFGGDRRT
ncbi:uncharacterized protein F4822DRAFT_35463 [Hypoxylon trugodes]|uniref:uncharacterized protein n=1 Tax=Hypoxylon trugodes TaxID=326681 RepID=UPI0021997199|nr:uncharacterized protein F4822DRAFT_35463 [Hypoxylon trugodes]KAI1394068.1 hypothetical protein F4822DRAFT_35463 [Hypoxylon trugodes]